MGAALPMTTIFLVDDHVDSRDALATYLRDAGLSIVECDNGRDALARLVGNQTLPAAIVLDLAMPVMSGQEFLRVMRRYLRLANVPVIVVTGVSEPIDEDASIVTRLTKPVEPHALLEQIRQVAHC